jgi:hypothetical protein
MTWDDIREMGREELLELVVAYSNYVVEYMEENGPCANGNAPCCVAEFYDNDYFEADI